MDGLILRSFSTNDVTVAFCPNPQCPHRIRTGKPAEFRPELRLCVDCNSPLVEENPLPRMVLPPRPRPLRHRLAWTLAVMGALWLGFLVPMPFLNQELPLQTERGPMTPTAVLYGPLSQGVAPYLVGFILVELFALALPRLRPRRLADPELRRKLWRASLILGTALSLVHGLTTGWSLEMFNWGSWGSAELVPDPGWWFRIRVALTMAAGSALFVLGADLINRKGVGSGFAMVILADASAPLLDHLRALWFYLQIGESTVLALVLGLGLLGAAVWARWKFFNWNARRPFKLPLVAPTCGLLPLELAWVLTMLPGLLGNLFYLTWFNWFREHLYPGSIDFTLLQIGLLAAFLPVASAWFYWRRREAFRSSANRPTWRKAMVVSGALLLGMVLLPLALARFTGVLAMVWPSMLTLVGTVAILADLAAELRARRLSPGGVDLVPVAVHQDLADALEDADRNAVAGAPAFIQGLRYRSLLYFFAPYLPLVQLGVPSKDPQPDPSNPT
jgi:hypothetical protein